MNEFLNPKSMLTPGLAGALMMLIANALCSYFPLFEFRYVALLLSFAIGGMVLRSSRLKRWERGVYWVMNSLFIFATGVGASNIAARVAAAPPPAAATKTAAMALSALVGTAHAQPSGTVQLTTRLPKPAEHSDRGGRTDEPATDPQVQARIKALEAQVEELEARNRRLQREPPVPAEPAPVPKKPVPDRQGFFRKW